MKDIIIKYTLISLPIGFILAFFANKEMSFWANLAVLNAGLIFMGFFLYEMVQLTKIEDKLKDKCVVCIYIVIGEFNFIMLLSYILGVSTESTWLGAVGVSIVFSTIAIMLFKIAKSFMQNDNMGIGCLLYMVIFAKIFIIIITNILIFTGVV